MSKKMSFEEWAERESIVFTTYVHYSRRSWNFCASQYEGEVEEFKKKLEEAVELIRFINSRDCPSGINEKTDLFLKGVKGEF